jgi:hypothetical protein
MPQTFTDLVEVKGAGDQTLELTSTDPAASITRLMAVTSYGETESQLQFKNKLRLAVPIEPRSDPRSPREFVVMTILGDGKIGVGEPVPDARLAVNGQGDQKLDLQCTDGEQSHVKLIAVNSNQQLEGQIQFRGTFSLTGIPSTPSNPDGNGHALVYRDPGVLMLVDHGVSRFVFDPSSGLSVGQKGVGGNIRLTDGQGRQDVIFLQADGANLYVGQNGVAGNVRVRDAAGRETFFLQADGANLYVGQNGVAGNVRVRDAAGRETIFLQADGGNITVGGDITLANADCAEEFDISNGENIEPGTVMVLDEDGKLQESNEAYDKRVAGVLSGAGDWRPGIILDKKQSDNSRRALALVGKVYCKVDARLSPIKIGDLLTTSETPGHAMKATESSRAFGAVIGKALAALACGQGLIPILVALQ